MYHTPLTVQHPEIISGVPGGPWVAMNRIKIWEYERENKKVVMLSLFKLNEKINMIPSSLKWLIQL